MALDASIESFIFTENIDEVGICEIWEEGVAVFIQKLFVKTRFQVQSVLQFSLDPFGCSYLLPFMRNPNPITAESVIFRNLWILGIWFAGPYHYFIRYLMKKIDIASYLFNFSHSSLFHENYSETFFFMNNIHHQQYSKWWGGAKNRY